MRVFMLSGVDDFLINRKCTHKYIEYEFMAPVFIIEKEFKSSVVRMRTIFLIEKKNKFFFLSAYSYSPHTHH